MGRIDLCNYTAPTVNGPMVLNGYVSSTPKVMLAFLLLSLYANPKEGSFKKEHAQIKSTEGSPSKDNIHMVSISTPFRSFVLSVANQLRCVKILGATGLLRHPVSFRLAL